MNYDDSSRRMSDMRVITVDGGEVEISPIPRVEITHEAFARLCAFIDGYSDEIAGLGRVERIDDSTYRITEAFLVEQWNNTGSHVDITEGAARFVEQLAAMDQSAAPYRFWWHSHVNFVADWSSTDANTAKRFDMDYLIALVGNKRRRFRLRFDCFRPVRVTFDNLPLHVVTATSFDAVTAAARRDIGRFVHREQLKWWSRPPEPFDWLVPDVVMGPPAVPTVPPLNRVPPLSPETIAAVAWRPDAAVPASSHAITAAPPHPAQTAPELPCVELQPIEMIPNGSAPPIVAPPTVEHAAPPASTADGRLADKILYAPAADAPLPPLTPPTVGDRRPDIPTQTNASAAEHTAAPPDKGPPPRKRGQIARFPFDWTRDVVYFTSFNAPKRDA